MRPVPAGCRSGLVLLAVLAGLLGCGGGEAVPDAYGNFEADEILVSAEANGKLLEFRVEEGDVLPAGARVGVVDTVQLALKRTQLRASRGAVRSRIGGVLAQIEVLEEQKRVALTERARLERLLRDEAATQKQLDDVDGQVRVLERQIRSIRTQNETILSEIEALDAQIAALDDQIEKSVIVNPVAGTVLATYAEPHELTAYGKPLYKLADLRTMYLRAYVSGGQLSGLRLGQAVEVHIDASAEATHALPGQVAWIAAQAEFTPKMIQTKEERVNLVYAFKVRVPNPDGLLKIGMPAEVRLVPSGADPRAGGAQAAAVRND